MFVAGILFGLAITITIVRIYQHVDKHKVIEIAYVRSRNARYFGDPFLRLYEMCAPTIRAVECSILDFLKEAFGLMSSSKMDVANTKSNTLAANQRV